MPARRLQGPFPLSERVIDAAVPFDGPGVYALGSTNGDHFQLERVGKATESLQAHLSAYVGRYPSFEFAPCASPDDAYDLLCRLYHKYHPTDNDAHPLPTGASAAVCPVCSKSFDQHSNRRLIK